MSGSRSQCSNSRKIAPDFHLHFTSPPPGPQFFFVYPNIFLLAQIHPSKASALGVEPLRRLGSFPAPDGGDLGTLLSPRAPDPMVFATLGHGGRPLPSLFFTVNWRQSHVCTQLFCDQSVAVYPSGGFSLTIAPPRNPKQCPHPFGNRHPVSVQSSVVCCLIPALKQATGARVGLLMEGSFFLTHRRPARHFLVCGHFLKWICSDYYVQGTHRCFLRSVVVYCGVVCFYSCLGVICLLHLVLCRVLLCCGRPCGWMRCGMVCSGVVWWPPNLPPPDPLSVCPNPHPTTLPSPRLWSADLSTDQAGASNQKMNPSENEPNQKMNPRLSPQNNSINLSANWSWRFFDSRRGSVRGFPCPPPQLVIRVGPRPPLWSLPPSFLPQACTGR